MLIIGLNYYNSDSAAALLKDGQLVLALQEERFTRVKSDAAFPFQSLSSCILNYDINQIDLFVVATTPQYKSQVIQHLVTLGLTDISKIIFPDLIEIGLAATFFASPFSEATILQHGSLDLVLPTTIAKGENAKTDILDQSPNNLAILYAAFTHYTGFKIATGQYKVMGLAPYGTDKYVDTIYSHLIASAENGHVKINPEYFQKSPTLINDKFCQLFGHKARKAESEITQFTADIAHSIQTVVEKETIKLAKFALNQTAINNICLGGGLALNCVINGQLQRQLPDCNFWVQPAANYAGNAIGAVLYGWHIHNENERSVNGSKDLMQSALLGNQYKDNQIKTFLDDNNVAYQKLDQNQRAKKIAKLIAQDKVIGLFQGQMEFGPRALGNRSILANPQNVEMLSTLNIKIKRRESFRPFAPACLAEKVSDYFEQAILSPYMLFVDKLKTERRLAENDSKTLLQQINQSRSSVPAITHVDYSARVQSVSQESNPQFHQIIKEFYALTDCPMIINTSFNVRGEPIVCSIEDAYQCYLKTDMDYLLLGDYLCRK